MLVDHFALEKIVREIKRTGADVCFFDNLVDNTNRNTFKFFDREFFSGEEKRIYDTFLYDSSLYQLWNKVFKKALVF